MKAMIMAAGHGQRMRPLSNRCPKPLLPVLGRPLIDYTLEHLTAASISAIGVNLHHLAEEMVAHLESTFSNQVEMVFSHEEVIRGTGGGMSGLRHFLMGKEPFLVYNGDVFSTVSLNEVIEFHRQRSPLVTMVLVDHPPVNSVTVSAEGYVVDFQDRRAPPRLSFEQSLTFTGISIVDTAILDLIPATIPYSIVDLYLDLIESRPGSICGYVPQDAYWIDVGTPAAYLQIHQDILVHRKVPLLEKQPHLHGIYQTTGSIVEPGAKLEGFVCLGKNCRVAKNAFLKNCVVWDNSTVPSETHFENGVIDGNWSCQVSGE